MVLLLLQIVILIYQTILVYIYIATRVYWPEMQLVYCRTTAKNTLFTHTKCFNLSDL